MASDFNKRHLIVETSRIKATKAGHIYSVKDVENNMDNGELVLVGDLIVAEREIYEAKTPTVEDKGVALIADVPLIYEQVTTAQGAEYNYYNEAGKATRAYELVKDDVYGVSVEAITPINVEAGVVDGNYVVNDGSRRLKEVATLDGTEGFVGEILYKRTFGVGDTRVYIRVIQN